MRDGATRADFDQEQVHQLAVIGNQRRATLLTDTGFLRIYVGPRRISDAQCEFTRVARRHRAFNGQRLVETPAILAVDRIPPFPATGEHRDDNTGGDSHRGSCTPTIRWQLRRAGRRRAVTCGCADDRNQPEHKEDGECGKQPAEPRWHTAGGGGDAGHRHHQRPVTGGTTGLYMKRVRASFHDPHLRAERACFTGHRRGWLGRWCTFQSVAPVRGADRHTGGKRRGCRRAYDDFDQTGNDTGWANQHAQSVRSRHAVLHHQCAADMRAGSQPDRSK